MKDLTAILEKINWTVDKYETCKLSLTADQTEMLRTLSTQLHWLVEHRTKANTDWLSVYFSSKAGSSAAKEREADFKVPEMYQIRHVMRTVEKVIDSIRSTISANKSA